MNNITTKVKKISSIQKEKRIQTCGFIGKRNGINVIKRPEMFDWFRKNGHLFFKDKFKYVSNAFYGWNGMYWETGSEFVNQYIYNEFDRLYDVSVRLDDIPLLRKTGEYKNHISSHLAWDWDNNYDKKVYVTFRNGTLSVNLEDRSFEFLEQGFDMNLNAIYAINYDFVDTMMEVDYWKKGFIGTYFLQYYDEYNLNQLQQFLASLLIPQYQPQQALVIQGDGGDGKGVLMGTLKLLFGNVITEVDPSKWNETHTMASLVGSVLNITNEAPSREISIDAWKSIIANDQVNVNPKNERTYSYKPYGKHLMTVNEMPKVAVQKSSLRRMPIIRTCKSTSAEERSVFFKRDFENNRDALIAFMLQGLFLLKENRFKEIIGDIEMKKEFIYENESTIGEFIKACLDVTEKQEDFESVDELFKVFGYWKGEHAQGAKDIIKVTFSKKLKTVLLLGDKKIEGSVVKKICGITTRGFSGVAIKKVWKKNMSDIRKYGGIKKI